jgi:predicted HD phosphohydrolase
MQKAKLPTLASPAICSAFGTIATHDYYPWNRLSSAIRRFTQSHLINHVSFDRHNRKINFTYFASLGLCSAQHTLQLSTQGFGTLSE